MHAQGGIVLRREARCEEQVGFVGGPQVLYEEEGENGARCVKGRRVGGVLRVPVVLEFGEDFGAVAGAEGEMSLCFVGFRLCRESCQRKLSDKVVRQSLYTMYAGMPLPSAYNTPTA